METTEPLVVDAVGKACPIPVIELAKAIERVPTGGLVEVLASDAGAKVDIPVWCRMRRQELVRVQEGDARWVFTVRRVS